MTVSLKLQTPQHTEEQMRVQLQRGDFRKPVSRRLDRRRHSLDKFNFQRKNVGRGDPE